MTMNRYRKSTLDDLDAARQARVRRDNMPPDDQLQEKLADLQTFVRQLANTPHGKDDLARRVQLFGDCAPAAGETQRHYYGKLRDWLDRECEASNHFVSKPLFT